VGCWSSRNRLLQGRALIERIAAAIATALDRRGVHRHPATEVLCRLTTVLISPTITRRLARSVRRELRELATGLQRRTAVTRAHAPTSADYRL